uniref:Uncharacterized protein n=1 Tax=Trypanosoma vivax (strain Y486) TaxID=1055687 RepID=G0U5B6_TRYVY|nr:hypothetical protein, unlikely [Trypanosoma vivax Y486]
MAEAARESQKITPCSKKGRAKKKKKKKKKKEGERKKRKAAKRRPVPTFCWKAFATLLRSKIFPSFLLSSRLSLSPSFTFFKNKRKQNNFLCAFRFFVFYFVKYLFL